MPLKQRLFGRKERAAPQPSPGAGDGESLADFGDVSVRLHAPHDKGTMEYTQLGQGGRDASPAQLSFSGRRASQERQQSNLFAAGSRQATPAAAPAHPPNWRRASGRSSGSAASAAQSSGPTSPAATRGASASLLSATPELGARMPPEQLSGDPQPLGTAAATHNVERDVAAAAAASAAGPPGVPSGASVLYAGIRIDRGPIGAAVADWAAAGPADGGPEAQPIVVIGAVTPGGACAAAGVKPGMLVSVDGIGVSSVAEFSAALRVAREKGRGEASFRIVPMEEDEIAYKTR